jgi:hypothetical protein
VEGKPSGAAGDEIDIPAEGDTVSDVAGSIGLTPALPISNEPNGIPVRAAPPGVVGDVVVTDEAMLLEVVPHGPDIAVLPGIDVPVPTAIPPPSKVVIEPDIPDVGLPVTGQVVLLSNGLSPGDTSCVEPMGIPVGGTCELGTMPSGEVAPMLGVGLPIPPTCAKAEPQPNSNADAVAIAKRVIMGSTFYSRSRHSSRLPVRLDDNAIKRQYMASRGLLRLVRRCFDRRTPAIDLPEASMLPPTRSANCSIPLGRTAPQLARSNPPRPCTTSALTRRFDDSCSASAR